MKDKTLLDCQVVNVCSLVGKDVNKNVDKVRNHFAVSIGSDNLFLTGRQRLKSRIVLFIK
jgi:hypothetical protein